MCLRFWQNRGFIIIFFCLVRALLTEPDLKALKVVLDPEMTEIVRELALLAHHVLLPVMEKAKKLPSPAAYSKLLGDKVAQVAMMATNPQLLSCATLPTNDLKVTAELAQALAPFSQEVADQLLHPTASLVSEARTARITLDALALVPEPARTQDNEEEEDDQEDQEDQEEKDQEELALTTATASQILVQLQHPSSQRVPEPPLQDKILVHAADAATSFLHKQQQHNQGWSLSFVAAMDPTSRAVECIFAVVKLFLARNSQMRVEVLNSLVVLHDLPLQQQVDMWVAHYNPTIVQRARKASRTTRPSKKLTWSSTPS